MMDLTALDDDTITYKGQLYHLDLDYRLVLEYFSLMRDKGLTVPEKLELALKMLVTDSTSQLSLLDQDALLQLIFSTYIYTDNDQRRSELMPSKKQAFDFDQDAGLIYAAFLQQYQIDLKTDALTWQAFNAMLDGLNDDTFFRKVVNYRVMDIPKDAPDDASDDAKRQTKKYQDYIRKMKLLYSLDPLKKEGKLTDAEVGAIVAPLDMPHKMLKIKELREAGRY
jgi:hypothetical protein